MKKISVKNALAIISAKLSGQNIAYKIEKNSNIANIIATKTGIFAASDNRIKNFNNISNKVILNTIFPYSVVHKDQIIAKIEVKNDISEDIVDKIIYNLSPNTEMINVTTQDKKKISLIYIDEENNKEKNNHSIKMAQKLLSNTSFLNANFQNEFKVTTNQADIDNAIYTSRKTECDTIFIFSSKKDKAYLSPIIKTYSDTIVCNHFPEVDLSDIIIATSKKLKIIALPYNYANKPSYNLDNIINKALLSKDLFAKDFLPTTQITLNETEIINTNDKKDLISPQSAKNSKNKGRVAGIILAAGLSTRAKRNKLLIELEDKKPLFIKSIDTAIKSGLSPLFIVLGNRHQEFEEYLKNMDINIIINDDYIMGVKSSISLALKSLPSFCNGACIIPADMPNISAAHLENMIKAFDDKKEKELITSGYNNIQANPVLWSKELFDFADLVPENSQTRPFFVSHRDYTTIINVEDKKELFDVTHPADIEELLNT